MPKRNKRIEHIDLAKGFCIVMVVIWHLCGTLRLGMWAIPYFAIFVLPMFYFLSGCFVHVNTDFYSFLKTKVNQLLIPFFSFYILFSCIIPWLLDSVGFSIPHLSINEFPLGFLRNRFPNLAVWFLLCLFLINLYFYVLTRLVARCRYGNMVALFILILLSALSFCDLPVVQHYYIRDMLRFEPFFVLGYLAKSYPFVLQSNKHGWSLMLLFFVTFPVLFFIVKYTWIPLYISTYIGGISGTICVLAVAKWFDRLPFFSYVGRNSLIILVTHLFLMTVLALSFKRLGVPLKIRYVIILITLLSSYYLIIPFVKRWLSPLLGQKTTDETYS